MQKQNTEFIISKRPQKRGILVKVTAKLLKLLVVQRCDIEKQNSKDREQSVNIQI